MMKAILATAALLGALLVALPAQASTTEAFAPASHRCVTLQEYRRVRLGMTKAHVHRIFDTRGRFDSREFGVTIRKYLGCPVRTRVFVMYQRRRGALRVTNKLGTGNPHGPRRPHAATLTAASHGCVTRAEYRRVKEGMRKARVHRIFDTRGRFVSRGFQNGVPGVLVRRYRPCSGRPIVVAYKRSNRVFFKDRIFVS